MSSSERASGGRELAFQGIPASPGIALARVIRLEAYEPEVDERVLTEAAVEGEIARFQLAVEESRAELQQLRETTRQTLGEEHAAIFDAHLAILSDPMAIDNTIAAIRDERKNAEFLFRRHLNRVAEVLELQSDAYFSERAQDIRDVKRRVVRRLTGAPPARVPTGGEPGIIVAHEVAPSEAAVLDPASILGLALDTGSRTSHVAIMARSRGIPAVVGLRTLNAEVRPGDLVVVDGTSGRVILNPSTTTRTDYEGRRLREQDAEKGQRALARLPAATRDGREVILAANMEMPAEADLILEKGASGVGLFRTEFFFMNHHRLPTEVEQYEAYSRVAERMAPHAVIIRTLDVGGDKFASYLGADPESNPFLGMRGIRFLMEQKAMFHSQLRAVYRASAHGRVKLLLPMISGMEELRAARLMCREVMEELTREGHPFDAGLELGVMIEVPSTVLLADHLAVEADFFSIGSNDLIQYTLAVDRGSERVAHLYEPLHPAVLRAIHQTVEAAHARGRWVGMCGEMACDPRATLLLVGLGIDELSVGPYRVPEVKRIIRDICFSDVSELARHVLGLATAEEIRAAIEPFMLRHFPDIMAAGEAAGGPHAR